MKILQQGILPEDVPHKQSCSKCKTKFEYTLRDVKHDRDGNYVECPLCQAFIAHGKNYSVNRMDD